MKHYKQKLMEMATAGKVKNLNITIWTDHNPPHFHIIKKDLYDVLIGIEDLEIIKYKFQKNNNIKMSSTEFDNVKEWLKDKTNNVSNLRRIKILWNGLNPDEEVGE